MEEPKDSLALSPSDQIGKLIGNSAVIKEDDGAEIVVPLDTKSALTADRILAAQGRHLLQETIRQYRADGNKLTPAELKAVMDGIGALAKASGPLYNPTTKEIEEDEEKNARRLGKRLTGLSFEALTKKVEPANPNESGQSHSPQEGEAQAVQEGS